MCQTMLLLCVSLACLTLCQGYETGAPLEACASMIPTVTLTATSDLYFEGFFVQARRADDCFNTTAIGIFSFTGSDVKVMSCSGANGPMNAITHSNDDKRTVKKFTWTNPGGGDVFFKATIVHKLATFWVDVNSAFVYDATKQSRPTYSPCPGSNNHNNHKTPTTSGTSSATSMPPSSATMPPSSGTMPPSSATGTINNNNGVVSTTVGTSDASNSRMRSALITFVIIIVLVVL